jgi:class 3 adenylate cyclase
MAGQPPSGTVTFLLTDLEGSTRLWEQDPDAMKAAMVRHDEILEKTIAAHQGHVFARMGDGMAAAFATARDAVAAAAAFQQALTAEPCGTARPLQARVGLHTDEAVIVDDTVHALRETHEIVAAAVGDERARELRRTGAAMGLDEAVSYALTHIDPKLLTGPISSIGT